MEQGARWAVELSDLPIPDVLDDERLARLGRALSPLVVAEGDLHHAARTVHDDLTRVMDLEVEIRAAMDEATATSRAIVTHTLPPYWPYLLGASVALALSGFFILARPDLRLPFIAGIGVLLLTLTAHYGWRLLRRARTLRPLQARFDELERQSHDLFHEVAPIEESLRRRGFDLETESFLPYRTAILALCEDGSEGDAFRERVTLLVTRAADRHPVGPDVPTGAG